MPPFLPPALDVEDLAEAMNREIVLVQQAHMRLLHLTTQHTETLIEALRRRDREIAVLVTGLRSRKRATTTPAKHPVIDDELHAVLGRKTATRRRRKSRI